MERLEDSSTNSPQDQATDKRSSLVALLGRRREETLSQPPYVRLWRFLLFWTISMLIADFLCVLLLRR